jgi:hypothetical protein
VLNFHFGINDIIDFVVVSVVLKLVIAEWLAKVCQKLFKFIFLRSEKDVITFLHFKKRAAREGHKPKTVKACVDEDCAKYNA